MPATKRHISDPSLGLSTLQDINALILDSHDLDETLENIVGLVAERAHSDVCSLYLIEENQSTLVLRATYGLTPESIGNVTLSIGEGLTGLVAETQKILAVKEPQNDPRYRYFGVTREEQFHSFLGIPLSDRSEPLGVLVIQTRSPRSYTPEETATLNTIAFQVASIVVNARLLDTIDKQQNLQQPLPHLPTPDAEVAPQETPAQTTVLRGKVAYGGVVTGVANIIDQQFGFADIFDEKGVIPENELKKLDEALRQTRIQTLYLKKRVAARLTEEDAAIFHTHMMILEDRSFIDKLRKQINDEHSAPYALKKVIAGYIDAFSGIEDVYLRERAADMEDIGRRLLANLVGKTSQGIHLQRSGILVARRLLPSDMAILDHEKITGMVLESNEANAHSVIMAKSLGIPALIGVKGAVNQIEPDSQVILDANSGCIYLKPNSTILDEYFRLEHDRQQEQQRLDKLRTVPARTQDGTRIILRANIGLLSDIDVARRNGAEGVGLYRTEFPYMARSSFPDRQDQYTLYKRVIENADGESVTIRTLDIGGDKGLPYFPTPREDNPFMGWRSVRVCLDNREIFLTQIEAILMASVHGPVRLLFPMISNIKEIKACRALVEEAKNKLQAEGVAFTDDIPLGAMIEVPAAVRLAPHLAEEVDFFSLGTNDLIQYMLAADRSNPLVENYYDPLHPAVVDALAELAVVSRDKQIDLCLCGEMATDPACLIILIGLGIQQFSLSAPCIPKLKKLLSQISLQTAQETAQKVLTQADSHDIRAIVEPVLQKMNFTRC